NELQKSAKALFAGALAGAIPPFLLRHAAGATTAETSLTTGRIAHNARLLLDPGLPWALGGEAFYSPVGTEYEPWPAPHAFVIVQAHAMFFVFAATVVAIVVTLRRFTVSPALRRFAAFGSIATLSTLAGFLLSPMVRDHFSARYLAAIVFVLPFTL